MPDDTWKAIVASQHKVSQDATQLLACSKWHEAAYDWRTVSFAMLTLLSSARVSSPSSRIAARGPTARKTVSKSLSHGDSFGLPSRKILEAGPPQAITEAFQRVFGDKIQKTKEACAQARRELGWPARVA